MNLTISLIIAIVFILGIITFIKIRRKKMTVEQLRSGIFNLRTRRFGSVAEIMIQRMVKLQKGKNIFHDLYDDYANKKIEVKFSTVLKENIEEVTVENVLNAVNEANHGNRTVSFSDWKSFNFNSNIQQIKKTEFDVLYYGLFFYDKIIIFKIDSSAIGKKINYSDKQHKGNFGEGQFHITQDILQYHIDNYHYITITYEKLLDLLT